MLDHFQICMRSGVDHFPHFRYISITESILQHILICVNIDVIFEDILVATCGSSSTWDTWNPVWGAFSIIADSWSRIRASVGVFTAVSTTQPPACLKSALYNANGVSGDVSRLFICYVNCFVGIVALFQNTGKSWFKHWPHVFWQNWAKSRFRIMWAGITSIVTWGCDQLWGGILGLKTTKTVINVIRTDRLIF